jgi:hypothetical protein
MYSVNVCLLQYFQPVILSSSKFKRDATREMDSLFRGYRIPKNILNPHPYWPTYLYLQPLKRLNYDYWCS